MEVVFKKITLQSLIGELTKIENDITASGRDAGSFSVELTKNSLVVSEISNFDVLVKQHNIVIQALMDSVADKKKRMIAYKAKFPIIDRVQTEKLNSLQETINSQSQELINLSAVSIKKENQLTIEDALLKFLQKNQISSYKDLNKYLKLR